MQNQHLVHVSLERGTMKLIFLKETLRAIFLSYNRKMFKYIGFFYLFTLAKFQ